MAEDPLTIGELGGYTNNQMNKEGLKKLVQLVNEGVSSDSYTKEEVNALLNEKQDIVIAGENISISNDTISFDNKSEWVVCENGITDIITYQNTHEFVIDLGSSYGNARYYFNSVVKDLLTQNSDLRLIPMVCLNKETTYPTDIRFNYSATEIWRKYVDTEHDIAYKIDSTRIRVCKDLITGSTVDDTNIDTYIDSTTGEVLKSFYVIIRPKGNYSEDSDYCLIMLVGAKASFSLARGSESVSWGPQFSGQVIHGLVKGLSNYYGDKYTLKTNFTYKFTITSDAKIYRRKKLTPNVELEHPTPSE